MDIEKFMSWVEDGSLRNLGLYFLCKIGCQEKMHKSDYCRGLRKVPRSGIACQRSGKDHWSQVKITALQRGSECPSGLGWCSPGVRWPAGGTSKLKRLQEKAVSWLFPKNCPVTTLAVRWMHQSLSGPHNTWPACFGYALLPNRTIGSISDLVWFIWKSKRHRDTEIFRPLIYSPKWPRLSKVEARNAQVHPSRSHAGRLPSA